MNIPFITNIWNYFFYPPVEKVIGSFTKTMDKLERVSAFHGMQKVNAEAAAEAMKLKADAHAKESKYATSVKKKLEAIFNPEVETKSDAS